MKMAKLGNCKFLPNLAKHCILFPTNYATSCSLHNAHFIKSLPKFIACVNWTLVRVLRNNILCILYMYLMSISHEIFSTVIKTLFFKLALVVLVGISGEFRQLIKVKA